MVIWVEHEKKVQQGQYDALESFLSFFDNPWPEGALCISSRQSADVARWFTVLSLNHYFSHYCEFEPCLSHK